MLTSKRRSKQTIFAALLLLTVAALAILLRSLTSEAPADTRDGHFVIELSEIDEALLAHLHVGDRVVDRRSRHILGDIRDIRAEESVTEVYSERKGALVEAAVPGKLRVYLTLGAKESGGEVFSEGGDAVRLGQTLHFRTYGFSGSGRVVALS